MGDARVTWALLARKGTTDSLVLPS